MNEMKIQMKMCSVWDWFDINNHSTHLMNLMNLISIVLMKIIKIFLLQIVLE